MTAELERAMRNSMIDYYAYSGRRVLPVLICGAWAHYNDPDRERTMREAAEHFESSADRTRTCGCGGIGIHGIDHEHEGDMMSERFFKVVLSETHLRALEAAADTALEQWDGSEDEDLAQRAGAIGAKVALANAEVIR